MCCAASWRGRLYSERWALECLHQVYRATGEFLAHAPRDAQEVLPPVLDDLIIALRSASSQPDLQFVGLVTVHRVQAQRRTLRALVTLQDPLSFFGYRDQRFPLSHFIWLVSHLASIVSRTFLTIEFALQSARTTFASRLLLRACPSSLSRRGSSLSPRL